MSPTIAKTTNVEWWFFSSTYERHILTRSSFAIIQGFTGKIRVLPVAGIVLPLLVLGDTNSLLTHNFHSHLVKEAVLFFSRFKSLSLDIMHSLLSCICSYIRLVMQQYSNSRLMQELRLFKGCNIWLSLQRFPLRSASGIIIFLKYEYFEPNISNRAVSFSDR